VAVAQETMQSCSVSLWLRKSEMGANRDAWGVHRFHWPLCAPCVLATPLCWHLELAILDKAVLGITGLVLLGRGVADAQTILIFDGSLAVITLVASVLAKAYAAWIRLHLS
jgi:hypothetical protein